MLQERYHACSNRHNLYWGNCDIVYLFRCCGRKFLTVAHWYLWANEVTIFISRRISRCHSQVIFFISSHVHRLYIIPYSPIFYRSEGGFQETILIYPSMGCQGTNQTSVRTFWCLNWANASIVRGMDISDSKSRTFTG